MWEYKWQWFYKGEPTSQEFCVKGDYNSCREVHESITASFFRSPENTTFKHSLNEVKDQ